MNEDPQLELIHQMLHSLAEQITKVDTRMDKLEETQKVLRDFINECQGGRKVLLYIVAGLGAVGALTVTLIEKIAK